jgi:hypothetical protein
MTQATLDFDALLRLRLVVARFGEMDLARWWNTRARKTLDGRLEPKDLIYGVWNKRGRLAYFVPFFGVFGEQPDSAGEGTRVPRETRLEGLS